MEAFHAGEIVAELHLAADVEMVEDLEPELRLGEDIFYMLLLIRVENSFGIGALNFINLPFNGLIMSSS